MEIINEKTNLNVQAIENGTVIDHIPSRNIFKLIDHLKLKRYPKLITFAINLKSNQLGSKAIIKVSELVLSENDLELVALYAPEATINIIEDFIVIKKFNPELPLKVMDSIKCVNSMCISNHENINSHFDVSKDAGMVILKCNYCEKHTIIKNS